MYNIYYTNIVYLYICISSISSIFVYQNGSKRNGEGDSNESIVNLLPT